jgi:hypothetical protein
MYYETGPQVYQELDLTTYITIQHLFCILVVLGLNPELEAHYPDMLIMIFMSLQAYARTGS